MTAHGRQAKKLETIEKSEMVRVDGRLKEADWTGVGEKRHKRLVVEAEAIKALEGPERDFKYVEDVP